MLVGSDGLPSSIEPDGYPIRIVNDGIVADDPDHSSDIVRRVRKSRSHLEGPREAIEKEACEILGVKELRDYFRRPGKGGFWDDHLPATRRVAARPRSTGCSSRRRRNYALWLYYHRLDKDLLFKALANYVEPKIRLEDSRLEALRTQKAALRGSGQAGQEARQGGRAAGGVHL